jgi:hypothetical protein
MPNTTREFQAAHHEASHAVIGWLCERLIGPITIIPDDDAGTDGLTKDSEQGDATLLDYQRAIYKDGQHLVISEAGEMVPPNEKQQRILDLIEKFAGVPEGDCLSLAAGGMAQSRLPDPEPPGDEDDWEKIKRQLPQLAEGWGIDTDAARTRIREKTSALLDDPYVWHAVERLAEALLAKREISGKEAVLVIRDAFGAFE